MLYHGRFNNKIKRIYHYANQRRNYFLLKIASVTCKDKKFAVGFSIFIAVYRAFLFIAKQREIDHFRFARLTTVAY